MRRVSFITAALLAISLLFVYARPVEQADVRKEQTAKAAFDVLKRAIGKHADQFRFVVIPFSGINDAFEVEASGGRVTVRGNSAIAMTRGAYHYLRFALHSQVTWSGSNLSLPKRLPDFPRTRITSPYQYRLYYNVCAFGYTTAFWGWKEWEKELDWMALHGINMPLAMVGQEAIWQRVWQSYGVTNDELSDYFTGPAFLPWHRMGNINKHDGPLPQSWLDQSRELQKKIVRRMKELGMQPVVPAFSGFVPPALDRHRSGVVTQKLASWADFDKSCQTQLLSADSPLYSEIGGKFIEEYRKEYGQFHFYLSDSFNEMEVPVTALGRYRELAQYGEAVYKSITAGDPNGVWVMQGWLFYNAAKFWDRLSVQALLSKIPDDRMDNLLASRNDRRLERWIENARKWGRSSKEKNYYEMDAKRQVTVWGGPVLSEYAAKVWSGLIRDYYAQRWKLYYRDLRSSAKPDLSGWQEQWITTPGNLSEQAPVRDVVAGSADLKKDVDGIKEMLFQLK
jgi:alpha-N-acetylglucosaminidase